MRREGITRRADRKTEFSAKGQYTGGCSSGSMKGRRTKQGATRPSFALAKKDVVFLVQDVDTSGQLDSLAGLAELGEANNGVQMQGGQLSLLGFQLSHNFMSERGS
jgi:hypothetical protein